jgi:chromosome partitioning protein
MKAKVITLATSKGGAGKSTLTRSLAAHWFNIGMKIVVIDADPQGSVINRHDATGLLSGLSVIAEPEESVSSLIEELKDKYNYIIVDTGGFRNRTTVRALVSSNLAIIPLKPSADDVAGALETYNLIEELNKTPERLYCPIQYRMIITMSQQNTVIARHVRNELEQQKYLVLKSEMYHRVAYPEAAINGLSPAIIDPESSAARDIGQIIKEINNIL